MLTFVGCVVLMTGLIVGLEILLERPDAKKFEDVDKLIERNRRRRNQGRAA